MGQSPWWHARLVSRAFPRSPYRGSCPEVWGKREHLSAEDDIVPTLSPWVAMHMTFCTELQELGASVLLHALAERRLTFVLRVVCETSRFRQGQDNSHRTRAQKIWSVALSMQVSLPQVGASWRKLQRQKGTPQ